MGKGQNKVKEIKTDKHKAIYYYIKNIAGIRDSYVPIDRKVIASQCKVSSLLIHTVIAHLEEEGTLTVQVKSKGASNGYKFLNPYRDLPERPTTINKPKKEKVTTYSSPSPSTVSASDGNHQYRVEKETGLSLILQLAFKAIRANDINLFYQGIESERDNLDPAQLELVRKVYLEIAKNIAEKAPF